MILDEARNIVYGDREKTYGRPGRTLGTIADYWSNYLQTRDIDALLTAKDVAMMMILLKVARLGCNPDHHDSLVDVCGYAALIDRIEND